MGLFGGGALVVLRDRNISGVLNRGFVDFDRDFVDDLGINEGVALIIVVRRGIFDTFDITFFAEIAPLIPFEIRIFIFLDCNPINDRDAIPFDIDFGFVFFVDDTLD